MFKVVSPMVVAFLSVVASTKASAQSLPAGLPESHVISMIGYGLSKAIDVVVRSSLTDPIAEGTARQAGAPTQFWGPQRVPRGTFPAIIHTFSVTPPPRGWQPNVIYMFQFYVEQNGRWYRTTVGFVFREGGTLSIRDIWKDSGTID